MKYREMHVLIVDDEPSCLRMLESIFSRLSNYSGSSMVFNIDKASSVSGALEYLNCSVSYDIIITDIRMPREDGFVLIEEIGRMDYRALIIANSTDDDFASRCLDMGCNYFINKEKLQHLLPMIVQGAFVCVG